MLYLKRGWGNKHGEASSLRYYGVAGWGKNWKALRGANIAYFSRKLGECNFAFDLSIPILRKEM